MATGDGEATDPGLIGRVGSWRDESAWRAFDASYRPRIRAWGRRLGVSGDDADELAQVVLVEAARRLQSFRYDPSRTFRGWLRRLTDCRAVDLGRARRSAGHSLADDDEPATSPDPSRTPVAVDPRRLRIADEVQQAVRGRVEPDSWRIFWMVRVEGVPVAEAASALGKTYAAAYRNQQRVAKMLRDEAARRLGPPSGGGA